MILFRFGFRRLEKDEEGDKEVDDRNSESQQFEEENLTVKETAKNRYKEKRKMISRGFRKEWFLVSCYNLLANKF